MATHSCVERNQQGFRVLGVPCGQPEFVTDFFGSKDQRTRHPVSTYPMGPGQSGCFFAPLHVWFNEANVWLRSVQPDLTEGFAERHDTAVWGCLHAILGTPSTPDEAQVLATWPCLQEDWGYRARTKVRSAAHFATWADALSMVRKRHPDIAESMIMHLEAGGVPVCRGVQRVGGRGRVGTALLRRKNQSPTNRGTVGNRKPPGNWRQGLCLMCGLA